MDKNGKVGERGCPGPTWGWLSILAAVSSCIFNPAFSTLAVFSHIFRFHVFHSCIFSIPHLTHTASLPINNATMISLHTEKAILNCELY